MEIRRLAVGVLALLGAISASNGCGISWTVPVTHFDGVDEKGHVCYSQRIGELDLGNNLKLPLIINFRSDRESSSPYLGKGWILALLDSCFVQTGENAFQMTQPDGWVRPFYRDRDNGTVLNSGPNWKAEIKGDAITAWAGCGWKLTYSKGRLIAIGTPKNRQLELVHSDNRIVELREDGAAKLAVEFDQASGQARALTFNGHRIAIAQGEKPQVQVIAGQNVIGGMDQSLNRLSGGDGGGGQFDFAVDDKIQPTLKIAGKKMSVRRYVWNPATKHIVAQDDWTYEIKPGQPKGENAAIGRSNNIGQREFWHVDSARGRTESLSLDGRRCIETFFVSGKLARRLKSRVIELPGAPPHSVKWVYDERGSCIRVTDSLAGTSEIKSESKGGHTHIYHTRNGHPIKSESFNPHTKQFSIKRPDGTVTTFQL